jgi:hypothetical protein
VIALVTAGVSSVTVARDLHAVASAPDIRRRFNVLTLVINSTDGQPRPALAARRDNGAIGTIEKK